MKKAICIVMFILLFSVSAYAHSGGTDSNGGHHDYNNVSGLGSYHYHHGYGAHLHENGICPYDSAGSSDSSSTVSSSGDTYTFTEDELDNFVLDTVNDDPKSWGVVRESDYEELQRKYNEVNELYEEATAKHEWKYYDYICIGLLILALYGIYRASQNAILNYGERRYNAGLNDGKNSRE